MFVDCSPILSPNIQYVYNLWICGQLVDMCISGGYVDNWWITNKLK